MSEAGERVVELRLQKSDCDYLVSTLRTMRDQAYTSLRAGKLPYVQSRALEKSAEVAHILASRIEAFAEEPVK